jgi:hypothetical protein
MSEQIKSERSSREVQINDYVPGDAENILDVLSTVFPENWDNIDKWRWKHCNRPGFSNKDIITARANDRMVACFHGATLILKLEPGITVPASFDGDFAVLPEFRGLHIPSRVHDLTDRRLKESGVALRGGFTSLALNERFYHKQFGYVFVPTSSINFRKIIGLKPLREKIEALGEHLNADPAFSSTLADHPVSINFDVEGFTPFNIRFTDKAFSLIDGYYDEAEMFIKAPYNVIMKLSEGISPFVKSSISNLLLGKLRIRGLLRARKSLFQLLRAAVRLR